MNDLNKFNDALYPLTHAQKRIWYSEKIYPNMISYNIGGTVTVLGKVSLSILEEAINHFIKSNDATCLRYVEDKGEVKQYISCHENDKLDFLDFSAYENPKNQFNKWVEAEASKTIFIENGKLFYFALFKLSDNSSGFFVKIHHFIADGWSINLMSQQIEQIYVAILNKMEITSIKPSYIEYIEKERNYLVTEKFIRNRDFWLKMYSQLPETNTQKSSNNLNGKRKIFKINNRLSESIRKFITENKLSMNSFFISIYIFYVYLTTNEKDIVIGTPVLNRSGKREKETFGMFVSTMPFRFLVDDKNTLLENTKMVNSNIINCYFNQRYPYDLLISELGLKKKGLNCGLFDVSINYYNFRIKNDFNGIPIEVEQFYSGSQEDTLQISINELSDSGELTLYFDYLTDIYNEAQIDLLYSHMCCIINTIIENPSENINKTSLLSEIEKRKLIYSYNSTSQDYPKNKTVVQLFEEQAERNPDRIAIEHNLLKLTYRELNEKSNKLARILIENGIKEDKLVAIMTLYSIETVVAIIATLKAGGAYLPIDFDYPVGRIKYMLEASNTNILLTNTDINGLGFNGKIIDLHDIEICDKENLNINTEIKPDSLAYVIYTSGSTGKPKGVMIEHRGLVNYICWAREQYVKDDNEVFALYTSLAFDLTVTSIFTPLISGNQIIVYSNDSDEFVLNRIVKQKRATIIKLTPSHLHILRNLSNGDGSVKRLIVGGEDLKSDLARDIYTSFNGEIEIYNEYGPTEATVGCMIHKYDYINDTDCSVPIGIPAWNVQIYILDGNLNPVPIGTAGEMYISGDGLARGYLYRKDLTAERFIQNPFINERLMYKTGDLARFKNEKLIEYIGRIDEQVKIRGYRIETSEIEEALKKHTLVKNACVLDYNDKSGNKRLCAYIASEGDIGSEELKEEISKILPNYMIPESFIYMDKIPLTKNGKVDKKVLREMEINDNTQTEFVAYRNVLEEKLINAISIVLNIQEVSVKDNFFRIGGDSIKAIQISSILREDCMKLRVKDILANLVIEDMAKCIKMSEKEDGLSGHCSGSIVKTPIIQWFFSKKLVNPNFYTQSVILEFKKEIGLVQIETVVNALVRHHDSLRINYNADRDELYYNNDYLSYNNRIDCYNLADISDSETDIKISEISEALKADLCLENGILFKACLLDFGKSEKKLLLAAHHIIVDGVSWKIILKNFQTALKQLGNGQEVIFPQETASYQKWSRVLKEQGILVFQRENEYWKSVIDNYKRFLCDFNIGENTVQSSNTIGFCLSQIKTRELLYNTNAAYNTETQDILVAALLLTLKELTGDGIITIEMESHGREDIFDDIEAGNTVGWFTSIYPVNFKIREVDLSTQIKEIKGQIRAIPNHGLGFGILRYLADTLDYNNDESIRFNYLGNLEDGLENDIFKLIVNNVSPNSFKGNNLTCSIDINAYIIDQSLSVLITYSRNRFSEKTISQIADNYKKHLEKIVAHCIDKKDIDFIPSDFDMVKISQDELDDIFS